MDRSDPEEEASSDGRGSHYILNFERKRAIVNRIEAALLALAQCHLKSALKDAQYDQNFEMQHEHFGLTFAGMHLDARNELFVEVYLYPNAEIKKALSLPDSAVVHVDVVLGAQIVDQNCESGFARLELNIEEAGVGSVVVAAYIAPYLAVDVYYSKALSDLQKNCDALHDWATEAMAQLN